MAIVVQGKTVFGPRPESIINPAVQDGLVLNLDASNPSSYPGSGTTWFDLTSNNNNGTLTNGPTFDSANGGSITFDGIDDYVDCNGLVSTVSNNNEGTIATWVKPENISGTYNRAFIIFSATTLTRQYLSLAMNDTYNLYSNLRSTTTAASGFFVYTDSNPFVYNQWIYVAVVQDGVSPQLYVNGVAAAQTFLYPQNDQKWIDDLGSFDNVNIGRVLTSDLNQNYFDGNMSSITYYNRALSSSEVLQNYNAAKGKFGI